MPNIILTFPNTVQTSVQINDIAYYVSTNPLGGFDTGNSNNIVILGPVISVGISSITYNNDLSGNVPAIDDFIMFSKDNAANMSSLLGYFARIKLSNNDTKESELFMVESNYFESSK